MIDYLNFIEERLDLGILYQTVGGMRFNTTVIETGDGEQQRNANWWLPLGRWQLGDRSLLESEADKLQEVTYLREFHAARKGSFEGFRFKDWSDYQIIDQIVGAGNGVETEWQLHKTYYAGSVSCDRPITKPVEGTVILKIDDIPQSTGWEIDHTSGLIRFDVAPAFGEIIRIDCEFDVPVWFESDSIGFRLEASQGDESIYKLENVFVEEGRIPAAKPLPIEPLPDLSNEVLDLGIIYDTVETIEYQTSKQKLPSGYLRRDDNYNAPITKINLGDRILDRDELDKLLGFFWCSKGKAVKFKYLDYLFNFNNDILNIKFNAKEENELFFNVSGLILLGRHLHIEDFDFTGANNLILYDFTFTTTNIKVPNSALIYLISGFWDTEGSLGSFETGEMPSNIHAYSYNRIDDGNIYVKRDFGGKILIGRGKSVNGTVIEKELTIQNQSAFCSVRLEFIW